MAESHTGSNVATVLKEAIEEWSLPTSPPIVTDNTYNMAAAATEAGSTLHVGCFVHTLNLACGKALIIGSVSKLMARVRRIVAYFHYSSVASSVLKDKQKNLGVPEHKLIIDVQTRWNSALDMLARFLEQQAPVYAALTSKTCVAKRRTFPACLMTTLQQLKK